MIKKLFALLFLLTLIISCGKKSDPIYNEKDQKTEGTKFKVVL